MRCRKKTECAVFGNLAINHRDKLVQARRIVEPRVDIFEQAFCNLSEHVDFVDGAEKKGLVQHRRQQRIGSMVPGHIQNHDPRHLPNALEIRNNIRTPLLRCVPDSGVDVETFLEVDVNQMIAAANAIERNDASVNFDSSKRRDFTGQRENIFCNLLEILQFSS